LEYVLEKLSVVYKI